MGEDTLGFPNDCWNAVVCEHVCFFVRLFLSVFMQVCVYTRLSAAPCFAVDSHFKRFGWHVKEIPVQTEEFALAFELGCSSIGAGLNITKEYTKQAALCANPHLCLLFTVSCSGGISQPSSHHQEGTAESWLRPQPVL